MKKSRFAILALALIGLSGPSYGSPYETFLHDPTPESAFGYIHEVTTHQRCVNCHGVVKDGVHRPMVGEDSRVHPMNISAKHNLLLTAEDHVFAEVADSSQPVNCRSCHQDTNGDAPGMPPGAANHLMPGFVWHMPPPQMMLSRDMPANELCEQWLEPGRNSSHLAYRGGRDDLETFKREFLHHVSDDPLVIWSWQPGLGRTAAPGTHVDFVEAIKLWINAGAPCPEPS